MSRSTDERFWARVDKTSETGCWIWRGGTNGVGYGKFDDKIYAHRYSYQRFVEAIPAGLMVDHRCHNPACVRPDHLRLVTPKQNCENLSGAHVDAKISIRGVTYEVGRFRARVFHNGRSYHLGRFDTLAEAENAVVAKRLELFTHNDLDRCVS